jgi:hypothetical protein
VENKGTIIRSIEEITISAKMNMQDMISKAIALGHDFMDAKELLGHGKFLPWLEKLGVSSSTASNYMKVAREIKPGTLMASLPYSKALALLSAPAEEREELAAQADDKSAAEIRKLIEERNRAAEAANTESARADRAEHDAKRFYDENAALNNKISVLNNECNKQRQYAQDLREKLIIAENNKAVEVVEKAPADYERLKKNQADLMEAAARAEERAAELEEQLEAARSGQAQEVPAAITLAKAMNAFFSECEMMPFYPADLVGDSAAILNKVEQLEDWCRRMHGVLDTAVDGKVVIV